MRAAVVKNGHLTVADDVEVRDPRSNEVKITVSASGLCRSDLILLKEPNPTAVVIGHEAAGVVVEVGSDVIGLELGDLVAVTCQLPCQRCYECARGHYTACSEVFGQLSEAPFSWRGGQPVRQMSRVSSLASEIVVDARQAHVVKNLAPSAAALIGCAVSTGYGNVKNVAQVAVGDSVAILGVGGLGVNAIQTARILGARAIVAVDINAEKEGPALHFGADQFVTILPEDSPDETAELILSASDEKFDAVVDFTGQPSMLSMATRILRKGGRLALCGHPRSGVEVSFDINNLIRDHINIRAAYNGACDPFIDFPQIVQFAETGRLNLADQVSQIWPLQDVKEALHALETGQVVRAVVDLSQA